LTAAPWSSKTVMQAGHTTSIGRDRCIAVCDNFAVPLVMHRNRWWSEVGQDLVEYVLLAGFVTLIVVAVPVLLLKRPDLAKNAALLALVGGVMGGLAWSAKGSLSALTRHAQLAVLETLNRTGPLSRSELNAALRREHFMLRWFAIDALVNLIDSGKITIDKDGRYVLAPGGDAWASRRAKRR
jgi:hypothetical protein